MSFHINADGFNSLLYGDGIEIPEGCHPMSIKVYMNRDLKKRLREKLSPLGGGVPSGDKPIDWEKENEMEDRACEGILRETKWGYCACGHLFPATVKCSECGYKPVHELKEEKYFTVCKAYLSSLKVFCDPPCRICSKFIHLKNRTEENLWRTKLLNLLESMDNKGMQTAYIEYLRKHFT